MEQIAIGVKEAALAVGLSPWMIRSWIRQGKVGAIRLGRRVMVEPAELQRLVQAGRKAAEQ